MNRGPAPRAAPTGGPSRRGPLVIAALAVLLVLLVMGVVGVAGRRSVRQRVGPITDDRAALPASLDEARAVRVTRPALERADAVGPPRDVPASAVPAAAGLGAADSPATAARRFGIRWGQPGLCPAVGSAAVLARRAALLAGFRTVVLGEAELRVAPGVPEAVLGTVAATLDRARVRAAASLDWDASATPPPVVIYRDDEQLRRGACINQGAIGYYDGSLHVSVDGKHTGLHIEETVIHEYLHHALTSLGVGAPMWLQEGLAMQASNENWFADPRLRLSHWLRSGHLPFEALVTAFPHTADEGFAAAAYYQSVKMLEFVQQRRGAGVTRALARQLAAGAVKPEDAFATAAGVAPAELEAAWADFVAPARAP